MIKGKCKTQWKNVSAEVLEDESGTHKTCNDEWQTRGKLNMQKSKLKTNVAKMKIC